MPDTSQSRTEAASQRRRDDARKRGQTASSSDLSIALHLLLMLMLISATSGTLGDTLVDGFRRNVPATALQREMSLAQTIAIGHSSAAFLIGTAAALLAGGFVFAILGSVFQVGFHVSTEALTPKPSRLSLANGAKKIFSLRGIFRTGITLAKFTACAVAMTFAWRAQFGGILVFDGRFARHVYDVWQGCIFVATMGALALVAVAAVDFAFQRWQHENDLKMTRQETKDETKENEGDPQIKARIRKLQSDAAMLRTLNDVPSASVVITNPTHYSVAIRYDRQAMAAPILVAKGKGIMARRIRRRAEESGVPIIERKTVARALYASVDVGMEIPATLYRAVAQILAHVYRIRRS